MTVQQELDELRKKVFLTSKHPKEEKDLWTKIENGYNDLLSENLRLRDQIAHGNVNYTELADQYRKVVKERDDALRPEKAVRQLPLLEAGRNPADGQKGS